MRLDPMNRPWPNPGPVAPDGIDPGLRRYMLTVYVYMAGGLAVTGITAAAALASGLYAALAQTPLIWLVLLAPFLLALLFGFRMQRMSLATAQALFWCYAALMGVSLAGIFLIYTETSIVRVFFIAGATFLAACLWGYTTRSDLTRFGSFLMMGLFGIIIASLVNLFLGSTDLQFIVSVIGVIVFTGLAAWDTQRIRELYWQEGGEELVGKAAILGALALYLDFVNLFLTLLQLFGDRRER